MKKSHQKKSFANILISPLHPLFFRCVGEFKQFYEFNLFAFFAWAMFSLSSALVTLQFQFVEYTWISIKKYTYTHLNNDEYFLSLFFIQWADELDLFKIYLPAYLIVLTVGFLFILCEPGHYCTIKFETLQDELGWCDWYALPIKLQKIYLIFLSNTQNNVKITGFGGITCERDTLKKVPIMVTSFH